MVTDGSVCSVQKCLAAEQLIARHAEPLGLGVEQRVLDCPHRLGDHAAGCRPGDAVELRVDALVRGDVLADHVLGKVFDRRRDPGRAKALIVFALADDAFVGRELDEAVVAPARVAMQRLDPSNFHPGSSPGPWRRRPRFGIVPARQLTD